MEAFSEFVLNYGYLLVAAWVFIDQLGVPIPANPVLVTEIGRASCRERV